MGTMIIAVLLAAAVFWALRSCISRKKRGGCCGDCSGCQMGCTESEKERKL